MQAQLRVLLGGIGHQTGIGHDDGINAALSRTINRTAPDLGTRRLRVGIECNKNLAPALVRVTDAIVDGRFVEVEPGEIARVGGVTKTEVNAVRAVVNGGFQRRQTSCRTNQLKGRGVRPRRRCGGMVGSGIHIANGVGALGSCATACPKRQAKCKLAKVSEHKVRSHDIGQLSWTYHAKPEGQGRAHTKMHCKCLLLWRPIR